MTALDALITSPPDPSRGGGGGPDRDFQGNRTFAYINTSSFLEKMRYLNKLDNIFFLRYEHTLLTENLIYKPENITTAAAAEATAAFSAYIHSNTREGRQ